MKRNKTKILISSIMIIIGITFLFPMYWMINLSFKTKSEVYDNPFGLPQQWVFSNYGDALEKFNFVRYLSNSLIYSASTIIITIFLGSMLAYCLSRMNWKFKGVALSYISMGLIIPAQVVIIPILIMTKSMGIKGTHLGLILPYAAFALSSCVLMLYAFFRGLPKELEESACIDGCNIYQSYLKIILPIVKPALSTQCVLIFMNIYNEFFLAFILAAEDRIRPLTVGLLNFFVSIGVSHWGQIGAAMIITSLPTIIVYIIGNEQIENALTAGAILK
ncbi:carbohydrate ABC transporter membrane protein 2 (CUT1 family) [Anaerobacterium chartisolvens]|uniref:Carbohydrate ABC transporter membrane protein 2 (CUT1 family) n=1 Tax=Anaerobacterium chartisolvens TaxID=1297424 RepID=A0A369B043_9FIRM|nr:carbohydrate ABC transporter permease [Anaerobacterium chartisolvens]RCX14771.1 carbohydrate ABC transporter membrane protein 2 (CUT1 family) [Anaerobacterium chartisolvens]